MLRKTIIFALCLCMLAESVPIISNAEKNNTTESLFSGEYGEHDTDNDILDISSFTVVSPKTVNDVLAQHKFTIDKVGHAFAAERGNDLADKIKGKNTRVVGDNNLTNGPDRLIINRDGSIIYIQDKYYANAKSNINACFDEYGVFRYVDGDGNPMLIEVPSDQYEEAVDIMKEKIIEKRIPGITDPEEANTLVKKGALSYKQAKNLAKAGTLESLKYDAVNGTITATCAFGISTLINYSICRINGEDRKDAIKESASDGLKTGAMAFGASVIAGQLSKTGIMKAFEPSSEALVKALGDDFAKALIESTGKKVIETGAEATAKTITKNAAKVLRSQALVAVVTTVVFTAPDAIDMFRGRISKKQFVKNFAVTAVTVVAGIAGAAGGGYLGGLVVPGVGAIPGALVGSILAGGISGWAADKLADYITEDDADEMYDILQNEFAQLCDDYIVNESEAENIVEMFNSQLNEDMFKDMYQSENREEFAEQLFTPMFEQEVAKREKMEEPTEEELRSALLEQLEGVVFVH